MLSVWYLFNPLRIRRIRFGFGVQKNTIRQKKKIKTGRRKMADGYDGNGDFSYSESASEFNKHQSGSLKSDDEAEENNPMTEKVHDYVKELLSEKFLIDKKYPHADRLLDQGK